MRYVMGVGVGIVLLTSLFFWRDVWSYGHTAAGHAREAFKESVPVGFELDRARDMVKGLTPEIKRNLHLIAREEVGVARLEQDLAQHEERLAKEKGEILRLRGDLERGEESYTYVGRKFSATQVKTDLAARFARYKTNEATREKLEKILEARQNGLDAARQKLDAMVAARRQLEVDIENLAARQKMIEVAETTSAVQFDGSQLAQTKELIGELRTRIEVAEKLVQVEAPLEGSIPLDETPAYDVLEEVTAYFGVESTTGGYARAER